MKENEMGGGGPSDKIVVNITGDGIELKQVSVTSGTSIRKVLAEAKVSVEGVKVIINGKNVELDVMLTKDTNLVVKKS